MYRKAPIPHTGKTRRIGHYLRCPSCIGFYRERESYPELNRPRFVPNSYDDLTVSNCMIRSWKRSKKKKQWE